MKSRRELVLKNNIKALREEKGYSQVEFAKMCGTTQTTISAIETDRYSPTAYLSAIIVAVLDKKWEEVFYLDEKPKK